MNMAAMDATGRFTASGVLATMTPLLVQASTDGGAVTTVATDQGAALGTTDAREEDSANLDMIRNAGLALAGAGAGGAGAGGSPGAGGGEGGAWAASPSIHACA